eukprot:scaffold79176_cov60-Phaeocystis_antarctica.AAC.5
MVGYHALHNSHAHSSAMLGSLSFAEATDPFALAPAVPTMGGGAALESNATRTERGRRVA